MCTGTGTLCGYYYRCGVVVVHPGLQGLEELPSRRTVEFLPFFAWGVFREGGNRGRGGRAGAAIWGKAGSPGQHVSRGTPDAAHSAPPPHASRTRPLYPVSTLPQHPSVHSFRKSRERGRGLGGAS